jgi:subtilisin family serine protease
LYDVKAFEADGTSMAAPHISGLLALRLAAKNKKALKPSRLHH